ncbi:MAG TPA: vWA domain-containing protein, partial [Gaiellaceae bacterium]|nr:vWA domain-containing protein [Gaiellaceae bacterium]
GLVVFSDTAYLALPPRTPARELRTFERFFRVPPRTGGVLGTPAENPWTHGFSAGTRISTGLSVALEAISRERLSDAAVLLISDLDNDIRDIEPLARLAVEYRERGVPLHVVALDAAPEDRRTLESLVGRPADVVAAPAPREAGTFAKGRRDRTPVVAAAVAAGFLALLIAIAARLRWSTT